MDNKQNIDSGFRVLNLVLTESNFSRVQNVTFENPEIKQHTSVEISVGINNNQIVVTEKVNFSQIFNDIEEVKCSITMYALFEKVGESKIEDLERFGKINGAAIIFPYIREHLTNLSVKAGLSPIILPPANFIN